MVILYADQVTPAMQQAIDETTRRRQKQVAYNEAHGIVPQTIQKAIRRGIEIELRAHQTARAAIGVKDEGEFDLSEMIADLEKQMLKAADALEFERAAMLRDQIKQLKDSPDIGKGGIGGGKVKPGTPGVKVSRKKRKSRSSIS